MIFTKRHPVIAIVIGLLLLFLLGALAGFGADIQRNWISRGRFGALGPDWHKSALMALGQTLPLIPAFFLIGRGKLGVSLLVYVGGIGAWLLLSQFLNGMVAQHTLRGRSLMIGASIVVCLMVALWVQKHARSNEG